MNKILIKTDYDCLLKINGKEELLCPNETFYLDENCKALVYPLTCDKNLYPFMLDTENAKNCNFFSTAKTDDSLLICFKKPACPSYRIESIKVGNSECKFEVGENDMVVSCKNWKKVIPFHEQFNKFTLKSRHDIALVHLTGENVQTIYAFNIKTGKARQFSGEEIEINEDGFHVKTKNPLSAITSEYKISAEGLKLESSTSQQNELHISNETVAFNFLSALKLNDIDTAYNFCDENLQKSIDKSTLKGYFGQIASFYFLSPFNYAVQNETELKIYRFQVTDQKITEIED